MDHNDQPEIEEPTANDAITPAELVALKRSQTRGWKILAIILGIALLVQQIFNIYSVIQRGRQVHDIQDTLEIVQRATSPDAQEEQAAVVQRLIVTVDCNNRESLQSFADQLERQGLIEQVTLRCEPGTNNNETTTTTEGG